MQNELSTEQRSGFLKSSTLLILAFATAFFPRLLDSFGAPAAINFLHFATIPLACGYVALKARSKDRAQLATISEILLGMWILLVVSFASALLNNVGLINIVLHFLLFAEPFILMWAIASIPMSQSSFEQFRKWLVRFVVFHILLALVQRFVLNYHLRSGLSDNIQGVFFRSGSGHVVGASVSVTFSIYYFLSKSNSPLWLRMLVLAASFVQLQVADAKQVMITFIIGFVILSLTKVADIKKIIMYVSGGTVLVSGFIWAIYNIPVLRAFRTWIRPEIYGPDGEATLLKSSGIRIILSHYHSPLNWLLGLGPGHTLDRLGGWMLRDYASLLNPLGATTSTIADETWEAVGASWLGDQSSFFSPFFGWAAIWGDIGFLGLGAYLLLWLIVWRRLCTDDYSKLIVLSAFVHGLIFTQMQEPGYMMFVAIVIGLRWQELRLASQKVAKPTYVYSVAAK